MKGKFISLPSVCDLTSHSQTIGKCQPDISIGMNIAKPPHLELFLVFGEDCLHLTTGNNNLASFDLPQRNSTPIPLTNNGWTLSPTTGATFLLAPPLAWGTFSLPLLQPMIPFDFPDLMLSSGRTKPPPFTPIHYTTHYSLRHSPSSTGASKLRCRPLPAGPYWNAIA